MASLAICTIVGRRAQAVEQPAGVVTGPALCYIRAVPPATESHEKPVPADGLPSRTASAPPDLERLTPAMRQYWQQKQQVGDALLLFRMGDFYEMFYDDAERGARLLGIVLTSRDGGQTPLAGIPHHALEGYLVKLVAAGVKVAISEQVEDASVAKGVVRREVVRIVTPGTLTDDALLPRAQSNLLAALCGDERRVGLASLELSSGRIEVQHCTPARVADELARISPAEVLLSDDARPGRHPLESELRERVGCVLTYRAAGDFAPLRAEALLRQQFGTPSLEGFGFAQIEPGLQAAGALLAYVLETQRQSASHLQPPRRRDDGRYMQLDATTLRSLEIERTLRSGARTGSLLAAVDQTGCPMGARLLRHWLCNPLRDRSEIRRRQEMTAALLAAPTIRQHVRALLAEVGDIERIIGRLGVRRSHPRDLRGLGESLARLEPLRAALSRLPTLDAAHWLAPLTGLDELARRLLGALQPDAPLGLREGGIFADGFDPELDRLRAINGDGQRWLSDFQAREAARCGLPNLKVGYNKVFGFYIEVSHAQAARVPADYVRKQTIKNAERYITDELKRYESDVLSAAARQHQLEHDLFLTLRDQVAAEIPALQAASAGLAEVDVLAGWAELAAARGYSRPEFVDAPTLEIEAGRHPVVEQAGGEFVVNDARLHAGQQSLALITGPNMAGKSTYIRQVALLTLLAHCGCYVPARRMRLGSVDRIFTRVGAADELARGQSTFMVEMIETANIVHNATADSLVILDEVGRGTSTFDGLALAWAIGEHLAARVRCRALFATHYHEMTELAELLDGVFNLNVAVREFEDQVVFLHKIAAGAANRSYGLHVARLAGVPPAVLERANAVLNELERTFAREAQRPALAAVQRRRARQLRLFEEPEEQVVRALRELPADGLSAEAARETLLRLRTLLRGESADPKG